MLGSPLAILCVLAAWRFAGAGERSRELREKLIQPREPVKPIASSAESSATDDGALGPATESSLDRRRLDALLLSLDQARAEGDRRVEELCALDVPTYWEHLLSVFCGSEHGVVRGAVLDHLSRFVYAAPMTHHLRQPFRQALLTQLSSETDAVMRVRILSALGSGCQGQDHDVRVHDLFRTMHVTDPDAGVAKTALQELAEHDTHSALPYVEHALNAAEDERARFELTEWLGFLRLEK